MKRRRYDSDDDDSDDFVEGPLLPYAFDGRGDVMMAMGVAAEESEDQSSDADNAVGAAAGAIQQQKPQAIEPRLSPSVAVSQLQQMAFRADQDVPDHWKNLMSEDLLQVYYTTLSYAESKRSVDDKLLSQYVPYDEERFPPLNSPGERVWVNAFGVESGWRWDGVVRGVGTL
ncbi:hypothetical protein DQ04_01021150 [Trypanosoma grayi]|uniref:hypothetical protein n=1 Tax=Trypanosoma grayi TaxID=71804 RepID=UPI0004F4215A|nr:hypothetical protein DQ04_01021150 [Trypanosoma grayi]KEG13414.1 hypothetical protein DQ04_01021150 [Trypanosoma grayi]